MRRRNESAHFDPTVPSYDNYATSRIIAGSEGEGDGNLGGYADGIAPTARVDLPLGIARAPDGTLIVADSGNRRIRTIVNVDPRGPVGPDLEGLYGAKGHYRVAVVGDSFAFSNVLWPESIGGRIETRLKSGTRPPFVSTVRLDGAAISDQVSFVREHFGDGQADVVVLLIDLITQSHEEERREMRGSRWRTLTPQRLRALRSELARSGTRLLVVLIPGARAVSIAEVPDLGIFDDGHVSALSFEQDNYRAHQLERFYQRAGIGLLSLQTALEQAESSSGRVARVALYNMRDIHLSPHGATLVGDLIADEIERGEKRSTTP